jgi:hypothetical protein
MKGAAGYGKHGEVSTAGANEVSDEERSEPRDRSRPGLSRWYRRQFFPPVRVLRTIVGIQVPGHGSHPVASEGDIRVLLVLDLLLSLAFASAVVWGLDFIGVIEFTARNVAIGTVGIAVLTYLFVLRQ